MNNSDIDFEHDENKFVTPQESGFILARWLEDWKYRLGDRVEQMLCQTDWITKDYILVDFQEIYKQVTDGKTAGYMAAENELIAKLQNSKWNIYPWYRQELIGPSEYGRVINHRAFIISPHKLKKVTEGRWFFKTERWIKDE